jgi:hypothetical protein
MAKKIAIADVLAAQFVTPAFTSPNQWTSWFLTLAVMAYSLQIYIGLSRYTDIARGAAAGVQGYATLAAAIAPHFLPRTCEYSIANRAFRLSPALQGCGVAAMAYALAALASESRRFVCFQF